MGLEESIHLSRKRRIASTSIRRIRVHRPFTIEERVTNVTSAYRTPLSQASLLSVGKGKHCMPSKQRVLAVCILTMVGMLMTGTAAHAADDPADKSQIPAPVVQGAQTPLPST